jgi:hypothetical protein
MACRTIQDPNGVKTCLNFEANGEIIGKSCAVCANQGDDFMMGKENGRVIWVRCSNRKGDESPSTVKPGKKKSGTVESSLVEANG